MSLMALLIHMRASGVGLCASKDNLKVSVPAGGLSEDLRQAILEHRQALMNLPAPYITSSGELILPPDAAPQYHWQHKAKTLRELKVPPEVWRRYVSEPYPEGLLTGCN